MPTEIDVLILNRNLKSVTEKLVEALETLPRVSLCGVIDSGSRDAEISSHTVVRDSSDFAILHGLRPNKGYDLGIKWWLQAEKKSEWLLLLPNDSELVNFESAELLDELEKFPLVVGVVPLSQGNPYTELLDPSRIGLVWNTHEGPLLLRRSFLEERFSRQGYLLDPMNYRGYLSFLELALQVYANNRALVVTDLISFRENQTHVFNSYQLIGTEAHSENLRLLVSEGETWLASKYGVEDRWTFEMIVRLVFEEFIKVNPDIGLLPLV
ncbi:unannotated protein [freshwater metagenome]|uniref:Unannotated protein n=1 Tax=freshwater metagenome TaxID=449393 RepID=A0A6J5YZY6_9ZZZZ|nr:hypothetical protein [Actinomycetota bacterium]MSW25671.1 hypothetical protein [Actinomycetota bacterium]MSW33403.1 hypothetical protein [Actinomycetota bacterium]MSX30427.1 hypothetical protein [Actinomycetota bacterium]MSX51341.1 hypothetical protein [Actinomycetota bacterium]